MKKRKAIARILALCILLSAFAGGTFGALGAANEPEKLVPFRDGITFHDGKFMNIAGEVVGTYDGDYVPYTSGGKGRFYFFDRDTDLVGIMTLSGEILLEPVYPDFRLLENDYFIIRNQKQLYGLADPSGKVIFEPKYNAIHVNDSLDVFSVRLTEDGKWGAIDLTGAVVIPLIYDYIQHFDEDGMAHAIKDGKYGCLDTTGNPVIPFEYDWMGIRFEDGVTTAKKNGKYGIIDKAGAVVVPFTYKSMGSFYEGLADCHDVNGGYIDTTGEIVIPFQYNYTARFWHGLAFVRNEKAPVFAGMIDKTGKVVIDLTEQVENGSMKVARALDETLIMFEDSSLSHVGVIDISGKVLLPTEYDEIVERDKGYWLVKKGEKYGMLKDGKVLLPVEYDSIGWFYDGVSEVSKDGKSYFFSQTGGFLTLESDASAIGNFSDGLGIIEKNGFVGFVDNTGKTVIPCQYRGTTVFSDGYAAAYDASGNWVILKNPLYAASSWAQEHIDGALALGLVPSGLRTHLTQGATRAEFCALAVTLYEKVTGKEITTLADFSDTDDINVRKMAGLEVVSGVGGGKFDPDGKITREMSAVLVFKLLDAMSKTLPAAAPTFADRAQFSSWAVERVGQVQASGIMTGVGDNRFDPQGAYTREMSIITMKKVWEYLEALEG